MKEEFDHAMYRKYCHQLYRKETELSLFSLHFLKEIIHTFSLKATANQNMKVNSSSQRNALALRTNTLS